MSFKDLIKKLQNASKGVSSKETTKSTNNASKEKDNNCSNNR